MQFLTPEETMERFGPAGYSLNMDEAWYRQALVPPAAMAARQNRLGCGTPSSQIYVNAFSLALLAWFKGNGRRFLWIDHWEYDLTSLGDVVLAARAGLGEHRSPTDAPGHLFDALDFHDIGDLQVSDQARYAATIAGLTSLVHLARWDAWLIAEGDGKRIEFWEGNVFFHAADSKDIAAAKAIVKQHKCGKVR